MSLKPTHECEVDKHFLVEDKEVLNLIETDDGRFVFLSDDYQDHLALNILDPRQGTISLIREWKDNKQITLFAHEYLEKLRHFSLIKTSDAKALFALKISIGEETHSKIFAFNLRSLALVSECETKDDIHLCGHIKNKQVAAIDGDCNLIVMNYETGEKILTVAKVPDITFSQLKHNQTCLINISHLFWSGHTNQVYILQLKFGIAIIDL